MYVHPAAWGVPYGRLTYFETCNKDRELAGPPRHGGTEPLGVGATTRRGGSFLADRGLDDLRRGVVGRSMSRISHSRGASQVSSTGLYCRSCCSAWLLLQVEDIVIYVSRDTCCRLFQAWLLHRLASGT